MTAVGFKTVTGFSEYEDIFHAVEGGDTFEWTMDGQVQKCTILGKTEADIMICMGDEYSIGVPIISREEFVKHFTSIPSKAIPPDRYTVFKKKGLDTVARYKLSKGFH